MNETKPNISAIYNSTEKNINETIEKLTKRIEKHKEKLNDPKRKMSFFDKMSANSSIKNYQEQISSLRELSQLMNSLYFSENNKHELPDDIKAHFDDLCSKLSDEEVNELGKIVNSNLKNANKENKDNIKNASSNVQKLLRKLKLTDKEFLVYEGSRFKDSISYKNATLQIERELLSNLTPEYVFLHQDSKEVSLPIEEQILLSNIEKMIKSGTLDKSNSVKAIVDNFSQIKDSFISKEKYNNVLVDILNIISEINNIKDSYINPVVDFLKELEQKYKKELEKTNNFLSKFNFNDVKNQIEDKNKVEEQENRENNNMMIYQNLAYELEKVQSETPNNYQKISELKEKMRIFASSSGLTKTQLDLADTKGKTKYHTDIEDNKAKAKYAMYRISYEEELKKNVMTEIREFAISKLKEEGAFNEEYEVKNGDVYSKPIDKETMIKRKMDELMKMADMSPVERGLYDFKRLGIINNNATVDDLSSQQLEEIKNNYSDSVFHFVENYKAWKDRENIKPQANTIYKEYIQYRASLKDKKQFLSFSEYAKQMHNIENMSDTMVNEDLIAEMREQSKGMGR